jgi:putative oxygen-independent coproporphyrinogen III oxidase
VIQRQLGIYIHWPYCAAICPYCDFNVYRARGQDSAPLVDAIVRDLVFWREQTGPRQIASIFFGGGTPSLMKPKEVEVLIETCAQLWGLGTEVEITLEANPNDAEAAQFRDLRSVGIERLSLGLQALDDASLKALGRFHSAQESRNAATLARSVFPRLSIDLIYARGDQTLADWQIELSEAILLGADHMSPYQLTIESGTAFERAVRRGSLVMPEADLAADFYTLTQDLLTAAGFEAYEVSNHAVSSASQSRHNLIYWTSQDWIGVGPGAHGRLGWGATRRATRAVLRPTAYIEQAQSFGRGILDDEILSEDSARSEFWLMGLRMKSGVRMANAPGPELSPTRVKQMRNMGFVWQDGDLIGLTPKGRIVGDTVIGQLLEV